MAEACPTCRHVVNRDAAGTARCANCGREIPPVAAAPPPPAARTLQPLSAEPPPPDDWATPRPTPPSAVASFVCGVLFFVPIAPQLLAMLFGLHALLRRRNRERVGLAWVGCIIGFLGLIGWCVVGVVFLNAARMNRAFLAWTALPTPPLDDDADRAAEWEEQMRRIHLAIHAYYRDYRRCPASIERLTGPYLPRDFRLAPGLTYRAMPQGEKLSPDWVLLVSDPTRRDAYGQPIPTPHRLLLRWNGTVDVLPIAEADRILAESGSSNNEESPEQRATNGKGE